MASTSTLASRGERLAQVLKSVPLLRKLSDNDRLRLAGVLVDKRYAAGETIIRQGEEANGFYIVFRGDLVVTRRNKPTDSPVELGRLSPGDFFGETGLLSNAPRGATVTVSQSGSAECFFLDRVNFLAMFSTDQLNIQFAKRQAVSAENTMNNATPRLMPKIPKDAVRTKNAGQYSLIMRAVQDNVLFMGLDAAHKDSIIKEMYRHSFKKGENAIVQGDLGDNLYVVEAGEFAVYVSGKRVATRGKGTLFGELALLYNSPRKATVTALVDSVVWVVDRFTFRRIVTDLSERRYNIYLQFLQQVPLLQPLAEYERSKIAEALEEVHCKAGQIVFRQGSAGDSLFIVYSGELAVTKVLRDMPEGELQVNRILAGGYFGERSLIFNEPRAATVTAATDVKLLKIDRNAFVLLLGPLEDIMKAKIRADDTAEVSARLSPVHASRPHNFGPTSPSSSSSSSGSSSSSTSTSSNSSLEFKSPFLPLSALSATATTPIATSYTAAGAVPVKRLLGASSNASAKGITSHSSGANAGGLSKPGSPTSYAFDKSGSHSPNPYTSSPRVAGTINTPSSSTSPTLRLAHTSSNASSASAATTLAASGSPLSQNVALSPLNFSATSPLSGNSNLSPPLSNIALTTSASSASALSPTLSPLPDTVSSSPSKAVMSRPAPLKVPKPGQGYDKDQTSPNLNTKDIPSPFTTTPSASSFGKTTPTASSTTFSSSSSSSSTPLSSSSSASFNTPRSGDSSVAPGFTAVPFTNLKVIGTLGKGSFGHVQLVQDKVSGQTFALKAVSKTQIVQTSQQGHVLSEKRTMMMLNHPFLVRLYQTYKDKNRLYFLLDPVLGGELFTFLRSRTLFDEEVARFYSAAVILGFEYMHDRNIVYRDLKPENVLLDHDGYVKITDFGFAKDIGEGRTWTLCGTPDYLAPEIVAGAGHGKGVDWWTLGIFIYEMLASYPPFYDEDPMKTYTKIMDGNVTYPSHLSSEAVSLIKKLLHPRATKRLGVVKGGAKLIKIHPWYQDMDWVMLINKKLQPAYIPNIKSKTDLSNFDSYPSEVGHIQPYVDDGSNWDQDF